MFNKYNISKHVTFTQLAKYFMIEEAQLTDILKTLKWIENKYQTTELGKKFGASLHTYTYSKITFIYWKKKILTNKILIDAIESYRREEESIKEYRRVVENYYKEQGYTLLKMSEAQRRDSKNIDYIAKKNQEIILMHLPSMNEDIEIEEVKEFEKEKSKFIAKNPIFSEYHIKLQYTLSGFSFTESAFKYLKKLDDDILSYQIIK